MSVDVAAGCTLAITNLPDWVDEGFLYQLFLPTKAVASVKMARGRSLGGGKLAHIEFNSHDMAQGCLRAYNGTLAPNCDLRLDLEWASDKTLKLEEYSAFVGDLATDVSDATLLHAFQSRYNSVFEAKVVCDNGTGRSKGFGFVRFSDEGQRDRAIREMHGLELHGRALRLSMAAKRAGHGAAAERDGFAREVTQGDFDPTNTTLFVGGLAPGVTDADLTPLFQKFGQTVYVRVPPGKGCGFVQFVHRDAAVLALQTLHGHPLQSMPMRISWGKNATRYSRPQGAGAPAAQYGYSASAYQWQYGATYEASAWAAAAPVQGQGGSWQWAAAGAQAGAGGGASCGAQCYGTFGMADPSKYDVEDANRRYCDLLGLALQPRHTALATPYSSCHAAASAGAG